MVFLEAGTLSRVLKCYNFNKAELDKANFEELKSIIKKYYSV